MKFLNCMYKNKMRASQTKFMISMLALLFLSCGTADGGDAIGVCSETALAAYNACKNEVKDDYWIAVGNCKNLSDLNDRTDCLEDADEDLAEAKEECKDRKEARAEICVAIGESAYDPIINPDNFVDFEKVVDGEESFTPNQYFPLVPGSKREYLAKDAGGEVIERILVEVLNETKEILGVNCIVVRDRVWEIDEEGDEILIEDTDDWYAQDTSGNVWYFGEISKEFEDGELIGIEGSWKAGRDFAKPGFLMLASPQVGNVYRQEFALGNAEDMAEVLSITGTATVPAASCSGDCVVTRDFTPIEPDVEENKYYASGIGLILEVNPGTGERVELIDITNP